MIKKQKNFFVLLFLLYRSSLTSVFSFFPPIFLFFSVLFSSLLLRQYKLTTEISLLFSKKLNTRYCILAVFLNQLSLEVSCVVFSLLLSCRLFSYLILSSLFLSSLLFSLLVFFPYFFLLFTFCFIYFYGTFSSSYFPLFFFYFFICISSIFLELSLVLFCYLS